MQRSTEVRIPAIDWVERAPTGRAPDAEVTERPPELARRLLCAVSVPLRAVARGIVELGGEHPSVLGPAAHGYRAIRERAVEHGTPRRT